MNKPEHERFLMFLDAWNKLKATGDFEVTQEAADRVQAMFGISGFKVVSQNDKSHDADLNDFEPDYRFGNSRGFG